MVSGKGITGKLLFAPGLKITRALTIASLNVCVVAVLASLAGSAAGGLLLGLSFGLGAIVIPALVYGLGMAYLGARLREQLQDWCPKIERISALLLVAVGISNLARW